MNAKTKPPEPKAPENPDKQKDPIASLTDTEQQKAEQQELMQQQNAELQKSVAEEFNDIQAKDLSAEQLQKDPTIGSKFIKLYQDYLRMQSKVAALTKERKTIMAKAARHDVVERRLSNLVKHADDNWLPILSANNKSEGLLCFAMPLGIPNTTCPALVMLTDGKARISVHQIDRCTITDVGDGVYQIEAQ